MVNSAPRHTIARTLTAGTLAALLGVAGCADTKPAQPAATPAAGASSGAAGFFGGTDLAWVEINIAMGEQLLPLLDLVPTHGSTAATKTYAATVKAFTEQELAGLRGLHDQAKLPSENPHEGMPMPGMVTPEQVTAAGAAKGAAFDKLLRQHLRAHFEQGTRLATSEEKSGIEPQTLALAKQVLDNRAAALKQLDSLAPM
jgi:uncharacterized protein (DUF305 family)